MTHDSNNLIWKGRCPAKVWGLFWLASRKRVVSVESEMLVKLWAPDILMIAPPPHPHFFNLIPTLEDGENKWTSVGKKKNMRSGRKKTSDGELGCERREIAKNKQTKELKFLSLLWWIPYFCVGIIDVIGNNKNRLTGYFFLEFLPKFEPNLHDLPSLKVIRRRKKLMVVQANEMRTAKVLALAGK
jgi:hypothetical protein